jgi:tripartite-type tricarboxylate transporter receptor subunit TctC
VGEFVPGYEASGWQGIAAPKNVPAEVVAKLNQEINSGLADAEMRARFMNRGWRSNQRRHDLS